MGNFREKPGEKTPVSLGARLLRRKMQARADGLSCTQMTRAALDMFSQSREAAVRSPSAFSSHWMGLLPPRRP